MVGGVVLLPWPAFGATVKVGTPIESGCGGGACDFTTIQGALDDISLATGDEIQIYPGTYYENLVIDDTVPEVALLRAPNVAGGDVVVNGGATNPALQISGGQGEGLVIQGLRLTNGRGLDVNGDSKYWGGASTYGTRAPRSRTCSSMATPPPSAVVCT